MSTTTNRPAEADQSLAVLLRQLSEQTQTLVRQELALAKAEMTEKGKRAGLGVGMFGGAGLFGLFAFAALTACFIALLQTAVNHTWLAALIVAVVYGAVAGILALRGKKEIAEAVPPKPEQTIDSIRDVKETVTS